MFSLKEMTITFTISVTEFYSVRIFLCVYQNKQIPASFAKRKKLAVCVMATCFVITHTADKPGQLHPCIHTHTHTQTHTHT